jgi:hypothetical protein
MKRFLVSAFAVVLLAFCVSAAALPAQAGTIDLVSPQFQQTSAGDDVSTDQLTPSSFLVSHVFGDYNDQFVDTFKFTIANITSLAFDITTLNHIVSMTFDLLDDQGNSLFSTTGFQGSKGDTHEKTLTFTGALLNTMLDSDFLTLKITGEMCSCAAYSILVSDAAAVTPIPAAVWMFLTALGGMGGLAWHRSKRQPAMAFSAA